MLALFFVIWMLEAPDSQTEMSMQEYTSLRSAIAQNAQAIALLGEQLHAMDTKLAVRFTKRASSGPTSTLDHDDVQPRIAALEKALQQLSDSNQQALDADTEKAGVVAVSDFGPVAIAPQYRPNPAAETAFENDLGKPLGVRADSIAAAFHAVGDRVQLTDVECRTSVCRVTYSQEHHDDIAGIDDPNFAIVENLVQSFEGANLDISYARNPDGEDIMYIQLL